MYNLPDLSIIGWDASREAMLAVVNLINTHRDVLSFSTDTDCFNGMGVNDVISYFERNPLKYCVLVADADKVKAVLEQEEGINLRLLQIADRNVGKFIFYSKWAKTYESTVENKKKVNNKRRPRINWSFKMKENSCRYKGQGEPQLPNMPAKFYKSAPELSLG